MRQSTTTRMMWSRWTFRSRNLALLVEDPSLKRKALLSRAMWSSSKIRPLMRQGYQPTPKLMWGARQYRNPQRRIRAPKLTSHSSILLRVKNATETLIQSTQTRITMWITIVAPWTRSASGHPTIRLKLESWWRWPDSQSPKALATTDEIMQRWP